MVFENLIGIFGTPELLFLLVVFVVFVVLMKRVVKTIINIVWITIMAAIFPFIASFLGFNVVTDLNTILFFITAGIGLYLFYLLSKIVYSALSVAEKAGKVAVAPFKGRNKEKKMEKKLEELMKKQEEDEKDKKKR